MISGVLRLDQIMSILLKMNKHRLLVFFTAHAEHNLINKKSDKRFNNRGYSLFSLMGISLKHL